jgi:hypothetical protein
LGVRRARERGTGTGTGNENHREFPLLSLHRLNHLHRQGSPLPKHIRPKGVVVNERKEKRGSSRCLWISWDDLLVSFLSRASWVSVHFFLLYVSLVLLLFGLTIWYLHGLLVGFLTPTLDPLKGNVYAFCFALGYAWKSM